MKTIIWDTDWLHQSAAIELVEKADYWPLWLPLALIFSCTVIVVVRLIHPGYLYVLYESSIRNVNIDLYVREDLSHSNLSGFLLHLNYVFITASIITIAFWEELIKLPLGTNYPWYVLGIVSVFVGVHLSLRYFFLGFISKLTAQKKALQVSIYNFKVSMEVSSIFLTILLIIYFSIRFDVFIFQFSFLILLLLLNLFYWIWSFRHGLRNGMHLFYIFLYLCTLEILPLVAIFLYFNENY